MFLFLKLKLVLKDRRFGIMDDKNKFVKIYFLKAAPFIKVMRQLAYVSIFNFIWIYMEIIQETLCIKDKFDIHCST